MHRFAAIAFAGLLAGLASLAGCTTDSAADCIPGTLLCPCQAGLCQAGLVCASNFCVDPNTPGSGGTGDSGPNATDSTTGEMETGDGDGDGDDTGDDCVPPDVAPITPKPPAPMCLPGIPCVGDQNCEAGQVCNLALDPPECETIYCGEAGTPCANDSVCEPGMSCHAGRCNPCDICGNECQVDFSKDPDHCGCCNNPIPSGGSCSNGEAVCPNGLTDCFGYCVDLLTDRWNCGSCGNTVGGNAECVDGAIECYYSGDTLCGNQCVDLDFDDNHCGWCDTACPANTHGCRYGYCTVLVYQRLTCTDACAQEGLTCSPVGDHTFGVQGACGSTSHPLNGCNTLPPVTGPCGSNGVCTCDFEWVYCECTL